MLAARASGSTMLPPVTKSCGSPSGLSFLCSLRGGFSHPRGAGPARRAVSRGSACCWSCTSAGGGFALIALGRSAARARCPARDLATRAVVLNATLDRVPVLYLSDPCSRTQLAERRDDWMCGDECLVDEEQEGKHADIADAPAAAREVADAMRNAAPDLRDIPICLSSESSDGGEIIVIGDPGPDPKKACLKALGIRKMCEDETIGEKKMLADPEMIGVWTAAFVETLNMTDKLRCGFNDDDPEEEEAEEAGNQKQILALTKIMSDKLQKHFLFNFSDEIVTAPVIYGGYASDGSIVGVLSSRVWT
ncbi:unnamed protein product [Symbiodinium sp. CCMP2592]|nr:unnamed protein product [Symbiodinium sp. CCMP2592]